MKFSFAIYGVVICIALCTFVVTADENNECIAQYLNKKGKLDNNFSSTQAPTLSHCRLALPIVLGVMKTLIDDQIKEKLPNDEDCLIKEFSNKEALDQMLKIGVIKNSNSLGESEIKSQLDETRKDFKDDLEEIAVQCEVAGDKFESIFNDVLGIKNETLAALESYYCLTKYAADNKVLPLDNVELNPDNIKTEDVDCSAIIARERRIEERDIRNKLQSKSPAVISCVMNAYKSDKLFDWGVAAKILDKVDLPKETKKLGRDQLVEKLSSFGMSTLFCVLQEA